MIKSKVSISHPYPCACIGASTTSGYRAFHTQAFGRAPWSSDPATIPYSLHLLIQRLLGASGRRPKNPSSRTRPFRSRQISTLPRPPLNRTNTPSRPTEHLIQAPPDRAANRTGAAAEDAEADNGRADEAEYDADFERGVGRA